MGIQHGANCKSIGWKHIISYQVLVQADLLDNSNKTVLAKKQLIKTAFQTFILQTFLLQTLLQTVLRTVETIQKLLKNNGTQCF